eukprot:jgi/Chlat1/3893/Chrsp26S04177
MAASFAATVPAAVAARRAPAAPAQATSSSASSVLRGTPLRLAPASTSSLKFARKSGRRAGIQAMASPFTEYTEYTPETVKEEQKAGPLRFLARAVGAAAAGAAGVALYKKFKDSQRTPEEVHEAVSGLGVGGSSMHTVGKGETLADIARQYNTSVDVLSETNQINNPDSIQAGQALWIPKTYVISKGDTLSKIAREHNTSVAELVKINSVRNPDLIFAGDIVLLP